MLITFYVVWVTSWLISKLGGLILIILLGFVMLAGLVIGFGILLLIKECTPMTRLVMMTHLAHLMILGLSSSSMTQKYKNNSMCPPPNGLLAAATSAVTSKRIVPPFPSSKASGMPGSRSCSSQVMLTPKFLMLKLKSISSK